MGWNIHIGLFTRTVFRFDLPLTNAKYNENVMLEPFRLLREVGKISVTDNVTKKFRRGFVAKLQGE